MGTRAQWEHIKSMIAGSNSVKLSGFGDSIISLPFANRHEVLIEYGDAKYYVRNVFTGQELYKPLYGPKLELYVEQLLMLPTPTLPEKYKGKYIETYCGGLVLACNEYICARRGFNGLHFHIRLRII